MERKTVISPNFWKLGFYIFQLIQTTMLYLASKNYMICKYKIVQLHKDEKWYVQVTVSPGRQKDNMFTPWDEKN